MLESEYRSADEVLLHLVAFEVRRAAADLDGSERAGPSDSAVVAARTSGFRCAVRWQAGHSSPLGLVARQAVADAVAADVLRDRFKQEAERLEQPWRTAVLVRAQLRVLGPPAEEAALRLLPTWRLPLEGLPAVAACLGGVAC